MNVLTSKAINKLIQKPVHYQNELKQYLAVVGRHSKIVAGKKNKLDEAKMKMYARIGVKITMAAKNKGTDPSSNLNLARALKEAESIHLPKENIERALKKGTETSTEDYSTGIYEIYGHSGVSIIVCTLTDNGNRTVKEIKRVVKDEEIKMASSGSVLFNFNHMGVIRIENTNYSEDSLLEFIMENNIDQIDIRRISDDSSGHKDSINYELTTSPELLFELYDVLSDKLNIKHMTASLEYFPSDDRVAVSSEDLEKNLRIIDKFEEIDDVDRVFHNMLV